MATSPSERGGGRLAPRERRRHRRQRGGDAAIRLTPVRAPSPPSTAAGSNAVRGPGPPQGGAAEELPLAAGHPLPLGEGGGQAAAPHHCYLSARTRERGREGGRQAAALGPYARGTSHSCRRARLGGDSGPAPRRD